MAAAAPDGGVFIQGKAYPGSQGYYIMRGVELGVEAGEAGGVTRADVAFDTPVCLFGVQLIGTHDNAGDRVDLCINAETPVGALTAAAPAGTRTFAVSATAAAAVQPGFWLSLSADGGATWEEVGVAAAVDAAAGTVTCAAGCAAAYAAGATLVALTVYVGRDIPLAAGALRLGYTMMAGKPLPASTVCTVRYRNASGGSKRLQCLLEYTY